YSLFTRKPNCYRRASFKHLQNDKVMSHFLPSGQILTRGMTITTFLFLYKHP
ncbi:unnamed protein product, partial [Musa hybrid cultivar]